MQNSAPYLNSPRPEVYTPPGALDGLTILRFAHAFETGGGVERLLDDLDHTLLQRNEMTILRMHISSDPYRLDETTEAVGRGKLIKIPLALPPGDSIQLSSGNEYAGIALKAHFRNLVLYNPFIWSVCMKHIILNRQLSRRQGQVVGAGRKFRNLKHRFRPDLCILHFFGGSDADEIVHECSEAEIPFVLENHFSNDRLLHLSVRKHATLAAGVSGVSGMDVPQYLKDRFVNLADGIDTRLFRKSWSRFPEPSVAGPAILLPARITRTKGHMDLIQAARWIKGTGIRFHIVFAGRVDSQAFLAELKSEIKSAELENEVMFTGPLSIDQMRHHYDKSDIVALPTYHHEGLPRIILEAQAMELPVVAYQSGGLAEGLRDGETGHLLNKGDIAGLTAHLLTLLGNPALRKQMGLAGRRFVEERFSLDAAAARHEEFYLRAMQPLAHL